MRYAIFPLLILLTACLTPNPNGEKDVVELIPTDNEISGWTRSQAMRIAESATQLYDLIDGEAQPYLDNGFQK